MIYTGIFSIGCINYSLVYLGDKEIIRRMMSVMIFVYVLHTVVVVPYMAVPAVVFSHI